MTQASQIRKRLLKQRGVELKRLTRRPVPIDELPAPYPKSTLMRLMELKFGDKLDNLIFTGTIYDVEKRLGIDASTVSKWRKLVSESRDKEFFAQFGQVKEDR